MANFADVVITGADVWCGDASRSWAKAVAIQGDRIVRVGTDDDVRDLIGPATDHRHLPGRMVTPGFQDSHIHPPFGGRNRLNIALNDIEGRENYLAVIRAYADANPDAEWIIGGGWAMEYFPGGTPRKEDLDAIVPDRPVFLFNRDVHGAWVNSRALEIAGIDSTTPDPSDGRIERDPVTGEPSGTLHEGAAYSLNDTFVPLPTDDDWQRAILNAQEYLHAFGITAWQDAWVTPDTLSAYRSLASTGQLTARVVGALWWERSLGVEQISNFVEQRATGAAGSFHPTTVKIMTDGVLENYTGSLLQPYCDGCGGHTDNSGIAFIDPDVLAAAVTELDRLDFQVHMHTIGDRAVRVALDAVQAARAVNGARDNRHHLAHIQVVQPADVPRFRELDVVANCQPYWAQMEPQMAELTIPFLGEDRGAMQYPFGDLLKHGTVLAMGSDWSVTTADVLAEIEVAVTRVDPENRHNAPFLPDQRIGLHDALSGFTAGTAYVNHDETESGSLREGMRADLAIIDHNLFANGAPPVADASVELTMASGRIVHDRTA